MLLTTVPDPVILHQGIYRALLRAMSRPGEICNLPSGCGPDTGSMAKGILETLLDQEVRFATVESPNGRLHAVDIRRWTHAQPAPLSRVDFLVVDGNDSNGHLLRLQRGTPEMPDQGATVIYFLTETPDTPPASATAVISGPGIQPPGKRTLLVPGVAVAERRAIREANQEFPMGIDCFFIRPDATVVGLPRSVLMEEGSEWPT